MPDLPPLPEPVPPVQGSAHDSFPRPVNVDTQLVTPAAPKADPAPASSFATTPRSNEQPPGRPPSFRLFVPTQQADPLAIPNSNPPAEHPVQIPVVMGSQTPMLVLEKKGPASIPLGQPLAYEIVVRNSGAVPAQQVRVEDELPAGTRLLAAQPAAAVPVQGGRLSWVLDSLPPGAERHFKVQVQPAGAGDWRGSASASVTVSVVSSLRTQVMPANQITPTAAAAPANLTISLSGPERVAVGQTAAFQISISNHGLHALKGLVLRAHVPAGLHHPAGPELEADLGTLEAGKTRNITLTTRAVQMGRFISQAMVATAEGQQVEARAAIQVMDGGRSPQ